MCDIYFWRQSFILVSGLLTTFSTGMMMSFAAVLSPALTDPNSTDIRTTGDHATWIAAIFGIGGVFGSLLLSPIMQRFGRKAVQHSIGLTLAIGWIILLFSKDITTIYVGRIVQGLSSGAIYIYSILIGEYVHPSRRGYFIVIKKVTSALGTLCCRGMGTFWTWRQVALFAAIPPFITSVLTCFWPESPPFLALRGRYSECDESFNWLNGNSRESQKELKALIEAQREKVTEEKKCFIEVKETFQKKGFQRALLLSLLLTLSIDLSGRYYLMAYLAQVMNELLGNDASATIFALGADSITVLALALSAVVIRYFNRRTVLFSCGILSVLLMLIISVIMYLKTVYTFSKYVFGFTALVLILQCFIVNLGIAPLSFTIIGEIFPLQNRGLGACLSGALFTLLYSISMKLIPLLKTYIELYGTFGTLGVLSAICFGVLYKVLPETKDKTLQDIEDEINGIHRKQFNVVENKRLMH